LRVLMSTAPIVRPCTASRRTSDRAALADALERHWSIRASGSVPPGLPGREDFALPGRAALEEALAQLDTPWDHEPFAEPARRLLGRTRAEFGIACAPTIGSPGACAPHRARGS
jgi:hypothetical protein